MPPRERKKVLVDVEAIRHMQDKARQAGLECIDTEWKGRDARYRLRCAKGHEFTRLRSNIIFDKPVCRECEVDARLTQIKQYAQSKGGKCLESRYTCHAKHRFVCDQGHEWVAEPVRMMNKSAWCPCCVNIARAKRMVDADGLGRLLRAAAARGGKCHNDTYLGTARRHKFECAHGHVWETTPAEIYMGRWCRHCGNKESSEKRRLSDGLERLQRAAKAKRGECLATEYTSSQLSYRFRCANGHEWDMDFHRAMHGCWCVQCREDERRARALKELIQIAHARGGKCLSTAYISSAVKLQWECDRGHQWSAISHNVRKGHWCPTCAKMNLISNPKTKAKWKYLAFGKGVSASP